MTALATRLVTGARVGVLLAMGVLAALSPRQPARSRRTPSDAGFTTIEWVVIALGLFLIAGIAVAAITAAVEGRLDQIT